MLHRNVLAPAQMRALEVLAEPSRSRRLYLGGGTAIALHLGHRTSVDLDWFTDRRLGDPARLAADLRQAGVPLAAPEMAEGTLHADVGGVPTSFLDYPYPRLGPLLRAREGYRLASLDDLACMKLSALVDRGLKKDFIDVYALLRARSLPELLALYERRFQAADPGHVLVALAYFDDAEQSPMPRMIWPVTWSEMRRGIERAVRAVVRRRRR